MNGKLYPVGIAWLIFIPTILFAQMNWEWQNPLPQGADMFRIISLSQENVTITGSGGTMLSTSNGGQSWNIQRLQNVDWVRKYSFISEREGWIVGDWISNESSELVAKIFKTDNAGEEWTEIQSSIQIDYAIYNIDDIEFSNSLKGFVLANPPSAWPVDEQNQHAGLIYQTNDGGQSWSLIDIGIERKFNQIVFVDSLKGFLLSQPYYSNYDFETSLLHYSEDGGNTWNTSPGLGYGRMQFVNDSTAWAGHYRTINGGQSWKYHEFDYPELESPITKTFFLDSLVGYAISQKRVLKTQDAGFSWNILPDIQSGQLTDIRFFDTEHGYICGKGGSIFKTDDGGESWTRFGSGSTENLNDVDFVDSNSGWAVGNRGTILSTTNGGMGWNKQDIPSECESLHFRGVDFESAQLGWAICGGYIINTKDGGQNWSIQFVPDLTNPEKFRDIHFTSENIGYAVGQVSPWPETGIMYQTIDGGESWNKFMGGNLPILDEIFFINSEDGWICGDGIIMSTRDAGNNWHTEYLSKNLRYIQFRDHDNGWVSALDDGAFYHTENGGTSWNYISSENTAGRFINSFFFLNNYHGIATSFLFNNLLTTENGGHNWAYKEKLPFSRVNRMVFIDDSTGWAVGDNGAIIHFYKGYFNSKNDSIPQQDQLGVYPNPFYGITTIYFHHLPNYTVNISIYDILGRHVATFTENTNSSGSLEYSWSPTELTAGLYIINIHSSELSQTIKAVLLK